MSDDRAMVLVDTTVLVDLLRGHSEAVQYLAAAKERLAISVLTVAELYVGARQSEELALARLLTLFDQVPVTGRAAQVGGCTDACTGAATGSH